MQQPVLSGMCPTGALHLGPYPGALKNWVARQNQFDCHYFVADWHALTTHYANHTIHTDLEHNVYDMVVNWLAAGIGPNQSTLFIQSRLPEHAELFTLSAQVERKVRRTQTDPDRVRRTDAGDPARCPVWQFHRVSSDADTQAWVHKGSTTAGIGCLECKQPVIDAIIREQRPWHERAEAYLSNPKQVQWIVEVGTEQARGVARATMRSVRAAIGLNF